MSKLKRKLKDGYSRAYYKVCDGHGPELAPWIVTPDGMVMENDNTPQEWYED